ANSALAEVRPLAERMIGLRSRLRELQGEQREMVRLIAGNGSGHAVNDARSDDFTAALAEFEACIDQLAGLGVQVKDADTGLLDFPAVRDGEDVLLCWRVGEAAVEWWHTLEGGFVERKPIDWGDA